MMMSSMLPPGLPQSEQRTQSLHMVNRLLVARNRVLTLFERTVRLSSNQPDEVQSALLKLLGSAIEAYMFSTQVTLYERLLSENERRQGLRERGKSLYPRIEKTTARALLFAQHYQRQLENIQRIRTDLSLLGQELAVRIELEDQLFNAWCEPRSVNPGSSSLH